MKSIKDWFSYDVLSKSLLSARPFSFFYEESSDGELSNQDSRMSLSATSTANHSSDVPQPVASENSYVAQYDQIDKDVDPLTQIEILQIKFLRIIQRISISASNPLVSQVLYRLQLASLIRAGETNSKKPTLKPNQALEIASSLEAANPLNLSFSFKILLIGKTGVGKSSTINSIFDQSIVPTNAFQPATEQIQEITRTIKGISVTIIDTPGLSPSCQHQKKNRKILLKVWRYIKNSPPDVVLYLERLDDTNRGCTDHRLVKLISDVFGTSIWCNTIIGMTHSSSYPHDISYDSFTSQSTTLLQHHIHQSIQSTEIQNQILLIENHPNCRRNTKGEKVLPNGQVWISQLLLLCSSTKVLGDANSILKFNKSFKMVKTKRTRLPSLPHFLSTLLHPQNFSDESGEIFTDVEDEYDQLPPIRVLSKSQYHKLSNEQRNAYLDELEYRETLYLKKQWNEEIIRRRNHKSPDEFEGENPQEIEQLPDVNIPLSFDHDSESYRYRCLMNSNAKWIMRPVLNSQGWDHDVGFDGVNLEASNELNSTLKTSFVGQIGKDKEGFNIQSESSAIYNNNMNGISLLTGIDVHGSDKRFVFTIHGDANLKSFGCNSVGTGFTLTSFEKSCLVGAKIEDSVSIGRRIELRANAGKLLGEGQVANGGTFEVILKGKDFPVRDDNMKLAASILSFEKETIIGGSLETGFRVGRNAKFSVNANLNDKRMGQFRLKFSVCENNKIGLIAVVSLLQALFRGRRSVEGY